MIKNELKFVKTHSQNSQTSCLKADQLARAPKAKRVHERKQYSVLYLPDSHRASFLISVFNATRVHAHRLDKTNKLQCAMGHSLENLIIDYHYQHHRHLGQWRELIFYIFRLKLNGYWRR